VSETAEVDLILEHARLAPSVHNTQPWSWHVHGRRVDLYADFRRQLVHADPQRRDLMISCGAALHHFEVAARALGWRPRVRRAPRQSEERLVASVLLSPGAAPEDGDSLLEAIAQRRTDRRRLSPWPLPPERLAALAAAGAAWGAQVVPVPRNLRTTALALTRRADEVQQRSSGYVGELNSWTAYWADEGVPVSHIPRQADVTSSDVLSRRFRHGVLDDPPVSSQDPADDLLVVCTSSDDTLSRIRAGEALSAVWLRATRDGISLVPLSQAVEVPETRRVLQEELLGDTSVGQLLLRVGRAPEGRKPLPATPRRELEDIRVTHAPARLQAFSP